MSAKIACVLIFPLLGIALCSIYEALYGTRRMIDERLSAVQLRFAATRSGSVQSDQSSTNESFWQKVATRFSITRTGRRATRQAELLSRAGLSHLNAASALPLIRGILATTFGVLGFAAGLALGCAIMKLILLATLAGIMGACAPSYYIARRVSQRRLSITQELSDVLDLIVVCVEAGLGLFESIKLVGEETARHGQAIGQELVKVVGELSAGLSLGEGLRNFGDRVRIEEVSLLAATLIQSEQLGAQIAPTLRSSSEMIRTQRHLRAQSAAQKTTIKMFIPLVVFILPAMMIVLLAPALIQAARTFSF
jgi:tight adherence protein C